MSQEFGITKYFFYKIFYKKSLHSFITGLKLLSTYFIDITNKQFSLDLISKGRSNSMIIPDITSRNNFKWLQKKIWILELTQQLNL